MSMTTESAADKDLRLRPGAVPQKKDFKTGKKNLCHMPAIGKRGKPLKVGCLSR